ncbi:MAG: serine/threonine-protein kinase [Planctomycetota bacterium]|nr:serine/threonine-protein kinase [Planctomycetota bacterium]
MILEAQHADDAQLRTLLFDDEASTESVSIAAHVESCAACQDRLRQLVTWDDDEAEARRLLNGHSRQTGPSGVTNPTRHADHHVDNGSKQYETDSAREYLSPPSHPEMLGRLGRYEIEREIGSGGMGVVFKGWDSELNRPVAIKVLGRHLARSGAARQRFGRESRAAAAVVHEHVVAIHNVESDGETPFLVMQFVAGESLQARVDRVGPPGVAEVLRVGIQTASGLAAAHEQGIVHRDVKPANILLEHGVERVLLTDFGLARTVDDASLTQTGIVAGTPHYMSPEQASGEPTDQRSDLFSLGSVLYFVATGHPPFRAERAMGILHRICHDQQRPVWQVNAAIPDELSDIIDRLLEKRAHRRFASATAVREALIRLLNETQQRRPSARSVIRRLIRRHVRWLGGGVVGIMLLIAFIAWQNWPEKLLQPIETAPVGQRPQPTTASDRVLAEVVAEISPGEPADFEQKMQLIDDQLRAIETSEQNQPGPASDRWESELRLMHHQLNQLQPGNLME